MDNTKPKLIIKKKTLGKFWQWDWRKIKLFPVFHGDGISWRNSSKQTVSVQNRKILSKSLKPKTVKKT